MRLAPEGWFKIQKSWKAVAEAGVEVVEWPLEDQKAFKAKQLELAQQFSTDPAHQELMDLTIAWGKLHGYL
jgi:tRNA A37 threonylcarbamoyladenosine biosynthesis protein TsaE